MNSRACMLELNGVCRLVEKPCCSRHTRMRMSRPVNLGRSHSTPTMQLDSPPQGSNDNGEEPDHSKTTSLTGLQEALNQHHPARKTHTKPKSRTKRLMIEVGGALRFPLILGQSPLKTCRLLTFLPQP